MAIQEDLVFTGKDGASNVTMVRRESTLTDYATRIHSGIVYQKFSEQIQDGWRTEERPGTVGGFAKWMGGGYVIYIVTGYIVSGSARSIAQRLSDIATHRGTLRAMARESKYNVEAGPFIETAIDDGAFRIRNMRMGDMEGNRQPFSFEAWYLLGD